MANQKFPQDLAIRFSVGDAKWLNERMTLRGSTFSIYRFVIVELKSGRSKFD